MIEVLEKIAQRHITVAGGTNTVMNPTLMGDTMLETMVTMMATIQLQLLMVWCGILLPDGGIH